MAAIRIIVNHVEKQYENVVYREPWRSLPEIPTSSEICPPQDAIDEVVPVWDEYKSDPLYSPDLPTNPVDKPWESKLSYIGAHYQILREDAIAPLRCAVAAVRDDPDMMENRDIYLYTDIHILGILFSTQGPAFRISFSCERAGKRIRWNSSKRLTAGTLVALTPAKDMFRTVCKVATIAARPIEGGVDQNPPQVDLFWGKLGDAVCDPTEPYVMVEARSGYFESQRHVLVSLQKLATEPFPLSEHLVQMEKDVEPPAYLQRYPELDLVNLSISDPDEPAPRDVIEELESVNVLTDFPETPVSSMDESQMRALKRMLTKRVAIVQGPPGTGKTFTSVSALKVMLANTAPNEGPILVAAQTNHALDQLLTHISKFEGNFVRLGGRFDKGNGLMKSRTLYELATVTTEYRQRNFRKHNEMKKASFKLQSELAPLFGEALTADILLAYSVITQEQFDSLADDSWTKGAGVVGLQGALLTWLGHENLTAIPRTPPVNMGLEEEEDELLWEQLKELEDEKDDNPEVEDQISEGLSGIWLPFMTRFTGFGSGASKKDIRKLLKMPDLFEIPSPNRGDVYRTWERQINTKLLSSLHELLISYTQDVVNATKIGRWDNQAGLIHHLGAKLIGCTTTGLSKYRGLIAALQPRIILIEEAAETLEAMVLGGIVASTQHLVLVGDHRQLQAHCTIPALDHPPYNMAVSMFERLVNNGIGYTMLNKQRRMIPEIRQLLCVEPRPFYVDLHDHPSVLDRVVNRPPIPGMGGLDSYFFSHNWPEQRTADSSTANEDEAQMIVGFFHYLVRNGTDTSKITVLTYYNGQRKILIKLLKVALGQTQYYNVFTVDSYQGEENDVILLSMVRSNYDRNIGFLDNRNRLVVALSRARRGLFIFGNAVTLMGAEAMNGAHNPVRRNGFREPLWRPIIDHITGQGKLDLDSGLPITCQAHGAVTSINEPDEWTENHGGCSAPCQEILPCGHSCIYKCHPISHELILCRMACIREIPCGHGCSRYCGEVCQCDECGFGHSVEIARSIPDGWVSDDDSNTKFSDARQSKSSPSKSTGWDSPRYDGRIVNQGRASKVSRPSNDRKFGGKTSRQQPRAVVAPVKTITSSARRAPVRSSALERGSSQAWVFDAAKEDKKVAEDRRKAEELAPKIDPASLKYAETYRPTKVNQAGEREAVGMPERRTVHRYDSPAKGKQLEDHLEALFGPKDGEDQPPRNLPILSNVPVPEATEDLLVFDD